MTTLIAVVALALAVFVVMWPERAIKTLIALLLLGFTLLGFTLMMAGAVLLGMNGGMR